MDKTIKPPTRRQKALQQFRDNPLVQNYLAASSLELAARGELFKFKELGPAPDSLAKLGDQILAVEDETMVLVQKYGMPQIQRWINGCAIVMHSNTKTMIMDNVEPWQIIAKVRTIVARSVQHDEELSIRMPSIWFVPIWQKDEPRGCSVCNAPCLGECCSYGCATIDATEKSIANGCFPEDEIAGVRARVASMKGKNFKDRLPETDE